MKSPGMPSQEGKKENPVSVERVSQVDQLKKDLKLSFWDFQAKNGIKATVVDFANDPSFEQCLNDAKKAGLSIEEMGLAIDYIRDNYGKKVLAKKDPVTVSPLDKKYDVTGTSEAKNNIPEQNEDDLFLKNMRADLDRIIAEADARDAGEKQRSENEAATAERVRLETQKQQSETRERERSEREAELLRTLEKKKQIESFVKNVEKDFASLTGKFYVKMREDQYEKAGLPLSVDRYSNYMNNVYNEVRGFMPSEGDLLFSIRDNSLVCTPGRSTEKTDLATFDLKDLDASSRAQALTDIKNKWASFVVSSRKK